MGIFASKRSSNKANIVLVHGFWADGSGWSKVISILQEQGHFVVAGQHAHTSLADDVATTRHLLAELEGPTLLVGHSYGGLVISEAATSAPGVVGLVYISAFMLDQGETLLGSGEQFPPMEVFQHLLVSAQGFAWIDPDVFPQNFANDIDPVEARALAVTQVTPHASIFQTPASQPAWKSLPAWALFGSQDRMIHPDHLRWMAQRGKAAAREISASHVPFLSHPQEVAHIILEAANTVAPA
ncbi:MAG TPA: alpha/beta hydrolase [Ktedonosporobacter sp.]|nr:alpha/beta hydrolase [Ktedonosporobacter sp.]